MENKKHLPMMGVDPIYSAFMFFCTGALMIAGDVFFCYCSFYWIFMSVLMKCTEEKWLKNLYGREYKVYYKKVNRCSRNLKRKTVSTISVALKALADACEMEHAVSPASYEALKMLAEKQKEKV